MDIGSAKNISKQINSLTKRLNSVASETRTSCGKEVIELDIPKIGHSMAILF